MREILKALIQRYQEEQSVDLQIMQQVQDGFKFEEWEPNATKGVDVTEARRLAAKSHFDMLAGLIAEYQRQIA